MRGIVWRYVQPEARPVVEEATPETPLVALGIDSLMMLEVVLDVQDALDLVIEDSDLRQMQTIGDVVGFLQTRYAETHPQAKPVSAQDSRSGADVARLSRGAENRLAFASAAGKRSPVCSGGWRWQLARVV